MAVVESIRDARPDEASALEALQRRASDVWEEDRAQLAAHPDAIEPIHRAIVLYRLRRSPDASGRLLAAVVDALGQDEPLRAERQRAAERSRSHTRVRV